MHILQYTRAFQLNLFYSMCLRMHLLRCIWYGIGETRKQILEGLKCNGVQYGDDQGDVYLKGGYLNVRVAVLGVYVELTFNRV